MGRTLTIAQHFIPSVAKPSAFGFRRDVLKRGHNRKITLLCAFERGEFVDPLTFCLKQNEG